MSYSLTGLAATDLLATSNTITWNGFAADNLYTQSAADKLQTNPLWSLTELNAL